MTNQVDKSHSRELVELVAEYRQGAIGRRAFFGRAIGLGMSVAGATLVMAQASGSAREAAEKFPKLKQFKGQVADASRIAPRRPGEAGEVDVDVRVEGIKISDRDLNAVVATFESALVAAINSENPRQPQNWPKRKKVHEHCL